MSNAWVTYLEVEHSFAKAEVILHNPLVPVVLRAKMASAFGHAVAVRGARVLSGCWWGNGLPSLRRVAGVRA